jgi:hypothetical protein
MEYYVIVYKFVEGIYRLLQASGPGSGPTFKAWKLEQEFPSPLRPYQALSGRPTTARRSLEFKGKR